MKFFILIVVSEVLIVGVLARRQSQNIWKENHLQDSLRILENGCGDTGGGGEFDPPLPTVPDSFITELEISFNENANEQFTIFAEEAYDGVRERGILNYGVETKSESGEAKIVEENIHYNVKKDEVLFIMKDAACEVEGQEDCDQIEQTCEASNLESLNYYLTQLFGFVNVTGESGFMGVTGILEFGPQFNFTYTGERDCHGMRCDIFTTCLEKVEENVTVLYTYGWTTKEWNMHNGGQSVPAFATLVSTGSADGHTVKSVETRYDFFNFRREFKPALYELEAPAEVYCTGRTSQLKPPVDPEIFSLTSEVITGYNYFLPVGNGTVEIRQRSAFLFREFYDYNHQITRHDSYPHDVHGEESYERRVSTINVFNQGLTYTIEQESQKCNISTLAFQPGSGGEVVVNPDGSIHMQSPWDIYDTVEGWQYNGLHVERGIEADTWTGVKNDSETNKQEIYVMYFASPLTNTRPDLEDEALKIQDVFAKVPIKVAKYNPLEPRKPDTEYNIISYESKTPRTHEHDISLCHGKETMRHYTFLLPAETMNETRHLRDNILYYTTEAIAQTANVSFVRINRIEIASSNNTGVLIRFTLLDLPILSGDVENKMIESDFDDAEIKIKNAINEETMVIKIKIPLLLQQVTVEAIPIPGSFKEVERNDGSVYGEKREPGFSSGDMAGLGCGMAILGILLGFFTMYIYIAKSKG